MIGLLKVLSRGISGSIFLIRGIQRDDGFLGGDLATLGQEEETRSGCGRHVPEVNILRQEHGEGDGKRLGARRLLQGPERLTGVLLTCLQLETGISS